MGFLCVLCVTSAHSAFSFFDHPASALRDPQPPIVLRDHPHALIHQLVNSGGMTEAAKDLPARIADVTALEELLSRPSPELVQALQKVPGDIMVLGVGGKMGPTLARMAKRADPGAARDRRGALLRAGPARAAAGARRRVHRRRPALARGARAPARRAQHRLHGRPQVRLDRQRVADLGDERARARRWSPSASARSRIVAFSTGLRVPVRAPSTATARRRPCRRPRRSGEYANSCVGARAHVRALLARSSARRAA